MNPKDLLKPTSCFGPLFGVTQKDIDKAAKVIEQAITNERR